MSPSELFLRIVGDLLPLIMLISPFPELLLLSDVLLSITFVSLPPELLLLIGRGI